MKYTIGSFYYLRVNLSEDFTRGTKVKISDRIKSGRDTYVKIKNINNVEYPDFIIFKSLRKRPVK